MALAFIFQWITGKKTIETNILQTIARFSGFALMVYAYIRFWDLLSVTYYGRTPAVSESLFLLRQQTPYNFGFWFGEVLLGMVIPILLFLLPRFNRNPLNLVAGAFSAVLGILFNRWNVTVTGLFVPVSYSPGTLYKLPPGVYLPSSIEWGVVIGIIGYAGLMLTLGILFLPLLTPSEDSTG
jgi:Ni/Fe-hydrogenase subunit HybB-like protein